MLYFNEYMRSGSGIPAQVGANHYSKEAAEHMGKVATVHNGYGGFWILSRTEGTLDKPKRVEYHGVTYDPRGVATWRLPLLADDPA